MPGSPAFTPQQVLDAGRRAEIEGRRDYAMQFYRHLTDHYADTAEAMAAREGLARLSGRPPPAAPAQAEIRPDRLVPPASSGGSAVGGNGYSPQPYANGHDHAASRETARSERTQPATRTAARVPRRYREHYFVGRLFGLLLIVIGVLQMIGGAGLIAIVAAQTAGWPVKLPGIPPDSLPGGILVSGTLTLITGFFVTFLGQLARAIFDGANAVRELAAIERARGDGHT